MIKCFAYSHFRVLSILHINPQELLEIFVCRQMSAPTIFPEDVFTGTVHGSFLNFTVGGRLSASQSNAAPKGTLE